MKRFVFPLLAMTVLSNCVDPITGAAMAVGAVTAPVWVPIEYANAQSNVVQPVNVVSATGKQIGPVFADTKEATFTTTRQTIKCTGKADMIGMALFSNEPAAQKIALSCGRKLKGEIVLEKFSTRMANAKIGPVLLSDPVNGEKSNVTVTCNGNFNVGDDRVDPFLLNCVRETKAVIVPGKIVNGQQSFEFFYTPPV